MTQSTLTAHAETNILQIKAEINRKKNAIGYSGMLGASQAHIDRLRQELAYYERVLRQLQGEGAEK